MNERVRKLKEEELNTSDEEHIKEILNICNYITEDGYDSYPISQAVLNYSGDTTELHKVLEQYYGNDKKILKENEPICGYNMVDVEMNIVLG